MESLKKGSIDQLKSSLVAVPSDASISEIIGTLKKNNCYEVFIIEQNKIGIITMRDLLSVSDTVNRRASSLQIIVPKLSPNDTIGKAAKLMTELRLRALPIVEKNVVLGAILAKTICQNLILDKEFSNTSINKVMVKKVITANDEDPLSKARILMTKNNIDHLPILNSAGLCGILLSRHIVFLMQPREGIERGAFVSNTSKYGDLKIKGVLDSNPFMCDPKDKALEVLKRMIKRNSSYSLVHLWDELQGIITLHDFIALLAGQETLGIPVYIVGLPDNPFESALAQTKFYKSAKILKRSYPKIQEFRSTIKFKEISSEKRRYEVDVLVLLNGKSFTYSSNGWNLPSIYDDLTDKMKRLLNKKTSKRKIKGLR